MNIALALSAGGVFMDLPGQMLVEKQLKLEKPEVIIRLKLIPVGMIDRVGFGELIRAGEQAAREALPEIHQAVSWQYQLR